MWKAWKSQSASQDAIGESVQFLLKNNKHLTTEILSFSIQKKQVRPSSQNDKDTSNRHWQALVSLTSEMTSISVQSLSLRPSDCSILNSIIQLMFRTPTMTVTLWNAVWNHFLMGTILRAVLDSKWEPELYSRQNQVSIELGDFGKVTWLFGASCVTWECKCSPCGIIVQTEEDTVMLVECWAGVRCTDSMW